VDAVVLVARLVLAGVLIVSATAKLRDRQGARQAAADLGVPPGLAPLIAASLAPLELLSAVLLLTTGWLVVAGAALAGLLLLAFTIAIVVSLARGRRVECHCFGALSAKPLSWWSVARNVALLLLAVLVLTGGGQQGWPWQELADLLDPLSSTERWLWVVVAALVVAVVALAVLFGSLLRRYGVVLLRLEALESAAHLTPAQGQPFRPTPVPPLRLTGADGRNHDVRELLPDDGPTLIVSVSPGCEACGSLVDDLRHWQDDPTGPAVLVVSPGPRPAITTKFGELTVHEHHAPELMPLGMEYTPGALGISGAEVSTRTVYGVDDIRRLYLALAGRVPATELVIGPPPLREGDPLPEILVGVPADPPGTQPASPPHPDGLTVSLTIAAAVDRAVDGDDAVLLFWDTTCGFCQQVTADVARRAPLLPLVVALKGDDVGVLRASGITSPVVLDPQFAVGNALQAPGTPCAVRVRGGAIASTVAVGGPEVLDLLAAVRISS
jgi:hypothetical protein